MSKSKLFKFFYLFASLHLVSLAFSWMNFSTVASAGEALFGRVYTTETMPAGHFEFEQIVRNRRDRSFGHYSAFDLRTEVEIGITDSFQTAVYVNTGSISAAGSPDDDDPNGATGFTRNQFYFQGLSLEFIYRVLSPFTDPIGLAFYFEPEVYFHDVHNGLAYDEAFNTEYRLLLQKNFFDDQLVIAYNLIFEAEFIHFAGNPERTTELDWNNELGISYRVVSNWFAGLEFRNHNEYGNFSAYEHSVFWLGPVIHYGGPQVWGTLAVVRQVYGSPSGIDDNQTFIGNNLFLRSHEKWEATAKIGFPF